MNSNQNQRLRIHVNQKAETAIRSRHPWLYSDSILQQNRQGISGELAILYGRRDEFLAIGFFDADSPIRVRVLHVGKPVHIDQNWWRCKFKEAVSKREKLFDSSTTGYRLIHGENDGWPGLVMDRYSDTIVMKVYTSAWFEYLSMIQEFVQAELPWCKNVVLRMSRNIQTAIGKAKASEQFFDGQTILGGPIEERIVFKENDIQFEADVLKGQKTGFFLDQRENRQRIQKFGREKSVLNVFSFSGAFSLYAARGGAKSVTDLDISKHALESSRRNFLLNRENVQIANCQHNEVQADAFEWLKECDEKYDLIIVDPPSLAKMESERKNAIEAYERLNLRAIRLLKRDAILFAGSCSAHVSKEEFFEAVLNAARKSGKKFAELERTLHPVDHPAGFKESEYLKGIYLSFD